MDVFIWIKATKGKIKPDEFLSWAKKDIGGGDRRSIANVLTNAKRAIHARIDEIIATLRVSYASDWPKNAKTDVKLKLLKQINMPVTSIAKVLTARRNDLEHSYLLPSLDQVRADVETVELWLDKSKAYLKPSVLLIGLSVNSIGTSVNANVRKQKFSVTFAYPKQITFFCDSKRAMVILSKSGSSSLKKYSDLSWKAMVDIQKNAYLSNDSKHTVPSVYVAIKLFRAYEKWLLGKRSNKFSASSIF